MSKVFYKGLTYRTRSGTSMAVIQNKSASGKYLYGHVQGIQMIWWKETGQVCPRGGEHPFDLVADGD